MTKLTKLLFIPILFGISILSVYGQAIDESAFSIDDGYNFFVANDLGRNGYYKQKDVAKVMGELAEVLGPEFIAAAGDVHHFEGVQSVNDPLWMTNYELIYDHPELMIEWAAILGNHEYRGNTQAVLDYSNVSRRWHMPARFYTKTIAPEDSDDEHATAKVFFIDTAPLIDDYRNDSTKYPDAGKQDMEAQLRWLEKELANAKETFKIVIGHHPIFVSEKKRADNPDLIARLDPLLRKYGVDIYVAGHSHTFQHLTKKGTKLNYIVNGSGSLGREPIKGPDTKFCSAVEGFSVISIGKNVIKMTFVNYLGSPIYSFEVRK